MSPDAIRLMQRGSAGGWVVLGDAALGPDFSDRIDELRVEALVRGRGPVPIDLWLPADQVLVRRWQLPAGARGRAEALRRVCAETGYRPDDLSVAVAPGMLGQPATVLVALAQTVEEARDYASRWGFRPGRVSTRVETAAFGGQGASFEPPAGLAARVAANVARPAAISAAAALSVAVLGTGAWALLSGGGEPGFLATPGVELRVTDIDSVSPGLAHSPFSQVSRSIIGPLARQPGAETDGNAAGMEIALVAPAVVGTAPELTQPSAGVPMRVGPAPVLPRLERPGRLAGEAAGSGLMAEGGSVPAPELPAPELVLMAAAAIAADGPLSRIAPPIAAVAVTPEPEPASLTEIKPAPEAPLASLTAAADEASDAALAKAAVLAAPAMAGTEVPGADAPAADGQDPGMAVRLAASRMAPGSVPGVPAPRPDDAPEAEPEGSDDPTGEPSASVEADPAEDASDLAAVDAPRPKARPEDMADRARQAAVTAEFGDKSSPAKVRQAASLQGLKLDSTSLIGVLDARSGRQALLRTAGGDFVKVGRGDTVEGWRVSTINRDAVRLTKGSQSRTLLLVMR